jgi:predicted aspartyl protease
MLVLAGYDPTQAGSPQTMTTASGVAVTVHLPVVRIRALGQERTAFAVLCRNLPAGAGLDGLLGLDFLRGLTLMIDFRTGSITLS